MRAALLLTAALAAGVSAKRVVKTEYALVTVTKTMTHTQDNPAPAPTATDTVTRHQQAQTTITETATAPTVEAQTAGPAPANTQAPKKHGVGHGHGNNGHDNGLGNNGHDNGYGNHGHNHGQGKKQAATTAWTSYYTSTWTSEPSTMSTTTTSATGAGPTNAYQEAVLYNHNIHRSNHSASSLTWSDDLESSAHTLASRCVYQHDTSIAGGGYGQNIGYGVQASQIGIMITNLMYNDEMGYFSDLYGEPNPSMSNFDSWGHFSQIVWKGTEKVGCATVTCDPLAMVGSSGPLAFTVCNYSPAGNYGGEYASNVGRPQGQPMYVA